MRVQQPRCLIVGFVDLVVDPPSELRCLISIDFNRAFDDLRPGQAGRLVEGFACGGVDDALVVHDTFEHGGKDALDDDVLELHGVVPAR
jgi:hypothetical protein